MAKSKKSNKRGGKKEKKNVPHGVCHIQATFNNTIISISDPMGNTLSWASSGGQGFKGSRKGTPFAAQTAARMAAIAAKDHGVRSVDVRVKGPGAGRESSIRALQAAGLDIKSIKDVTQFRLTVAARLSGAGSEELDVARYTGPTDKLSRREGAQLFLKGERVFKGKTAIERRPYPPGQHGRRRSKTQGYGLQLREKQKLKRMYGLLERQFRNTFKRAASQKGITGENLLRMLEQRLDNVVYRLGFGSSRPMARQLVAHGHILVNGKKMDIPSAQIDENAVISLREGSRKNEHIKICLDTAKGRGVPDWLELDADQFQGSVKRLPKRDDIPVPVEEQLIVELYSK